MLNTIDNIMRHANSCSSFVSCDNTGSTGAVGEKGLPGVPGATGVLYIGLCISNVIIYIHFYYVHV